MRKLSQWFKNLKKPERVLLVIGIVLLMGTVVSAAGNDQPTAKPAPNTGHAKAKSTVSYKTETETQKIPFDSQTVQDPNLPKGQSKITTAGVDGSQTATYKVTYENGRQTGKKLVGTTVTAQPVAQVTSVGTYEAPPPAPAPSCPNGTYVNSAGNTVCSPYTSPSQPAGATAQCADGSYSFSQSRSGTCSHHGGVARWL